VASLPELRQRFRSDAPGTQVRLEIRKGETKREVVLTLRDLV
jgi:hypothetical protein